MKYSVTCKWRSLPY